MTFEYIKEKCDATEAMIKDGLSQEFIDHEHFYFQAKNDIFELKEELKQYFKEQEEILVNTPLTRNEYKKKLETLQKIYKKTYTYLCSREQEFKDAVTDNFFNEISQDVPKERKERIVKFLMQRDVFGHMGFGEIEYLFYDLNNLIEQG